MVLITISILGMVGLVLSLYYFYLQKKVDHNEDIKAICDINNRISCTKSMKTKYSKIAIVSNSVFGMLFYLLIIFLGIFNFGEIIFYFAIAAILSSTYLAYLQFFKLKTICIICNGIYIVNILILYHGYLAAFVN